jgi:hypothetical protein
VPARVPTNTSPVLMPDPHLEQVVEIGLVDVPGEHLMHPQCRAPHVRHRPRGHRCAEQGEDAVAQELVDAAAERGDHLDQALEHAVDEPLHLLGVEVLGEGGEADDIAEQDGDDASFLGLTCRDGVAAGGAEARSRGQGRCARGAEHHSRSVRHIHRRGRRFRRPRGSREKTGWCCGGARHPRAPRLFVLLVAALAIAAPRCAIRLRRPHLVVTVAGGRSR